MNSPKDLSTASLCPRCLRRIEAHLLVREGNVLLEKHCNEHGTTTALLSRHPDYFLPLRRFYFALNRGSYPQKDFIVHLTDRCNMACPICLAEAGQRHTEDYPTEDLLGFLRGKRGCKIDLMGAEPTTRAELPELIRRILRSGNLAALHTNGIRLADPAYCRTLRRAGLREVHLQFDGFDDRVNRCLRGGDYAAEKLRTLANLERLGFSVDLVVTLARGVNEDQIAPILDFAATHPFVKEVFFLGCRFLGRAKAQALERCLTPDEVIDLVEEHTLGLLERADLRRFQKLYFTLLSLFKIRKCFYIQHYLFLRDRGTLVPLAKAFPLAALEPVLDRYRSHVEAGKPQARATLLLAAARILGKTVTPSLAWELGSFVLPFARGFDLARLPARPLLIGFISACDGLIYDEAVAQNCGKGAISKELGVQSCGALDNVVRDVVLSGGPR